MRNSIIPWNEREKLISTIPSTTLRTSYFRTFVLFLFLPFFLSSDSFFHWRASPDGVLYTAVVGTVGDPVNRCNIWAHDAPSLWQSSPKYMAFLQTFKEQYSIVYSCPSICSIRMAVRDEYFLLVLSLISVSSKTFFSEKIPGHVTRMFSPVCIQCLICW